jgi:hypothetical protein
VDIVSSGWYSGKIWWSRNPGKPGAMGEDHLIDEGYPVEFSFLADLDNDGKAREILPPLAIRPRRPPGTRQRVAPSRSRWSAR